MFTSLKEAAARQDFPQLMDMGMKTSVMKAYGAPANEYEVLVDMETSTKDKETYPTLSKQGYPVKVLEGQPYPEKPIGKMTYVEVTNYKHGKILAITREMVDDDQTREVKNLPLEAGQSHIDGENKEFFSTLVGGTTAGTAPDGLALFTTNHYDRPSGTVKTDNDNIYTAVTMTAGALIVACDMINLWTGIDGEEINILPVRIVCSLRLGPTARWLLDPMGGLPAYAANNLGAASAYANMSGRNPVAAQFNLGLSVCTWLTKVGGAAADWYIRTNVKSTIWQIRDPLETYAEGNLSSSWFGRDVMRWKTRKRYGHKHIDWRGWMLVS